MSFINALTSYARREKILPNEVYSNAIRKKTGSDGTKHFSWEVKQNKERPLCGSFYQRALYEASYGLSCGLQSIRLE